MARPERRDCDYFPFYAKDGRTLFLLESKYKCQGTGFFTNVMRFLTLETDHHVSILDETDAMYFFSKCHCDSESGINMLNIMAKTGKINKELWAVSVIASQSLLDSLADAYRNRKNNIVTMPEIKKKYISDAGNRVSDAGNPQEIVVSDVKKPQRKGKERKEKKPQEFFLSDSTEYRLANYLLNFILKRNPNHKKPDIQKWAKNIELMIRIDKRKSDDIKSVIEWCQKDIIEDGKWKGWANNILSPAKLREKYDILYIKMQEAKIETQPSKKIYLE